MRVCVCVDLNEKKVHWTYKNIYYISRLVSKVHVFSYTLNAKSIPPFKLTDEAGWRGELRVARGDEVVDLRQHKINM